MASPTMTDSPIRTIATRAGRIAGTVIRAILMLAVAAAIVIPIGYAVLAGFKDSGQIAADPIGLPDPWVFTNYTEILSSGVFWQEMGNSIFIAALSTGMVVHLRGARGVRLRPAQLPRP